MKKIIFSIILAGVIIMSFTACGNSKAEEYSAEELAEMYYEPEKGDYNITVFNGDNAYKINYEDGVAYVYDQDKGSMTTHPLK